MTLHETIAKSLGYKSVFDALNSNLELFSTEEQNEIKKLGG